MRHIAVVLLAALVLGGCAGISREECQFSDWRAVGYEDGAEGRVSQDFARYRKACADQGVATDFAAYQQGREAGLREYCRAARGFQEGSRGNRYFGVCPVALEPQFLAGYTDGRRLFDVQSDFDETCRQIQWREQRIRDIEHELADLAGAAMTGAVFKGDAAHAIVQTKQLAAERVKLARELDDLRARQVEVERELATTRAEVLARR